MCGIAGNINFNNQNDPSIIKVMTNTMAHRGPDADGFYSDNYISLGHRRLSIIDLSEQANQPIYSTCGNYAIIFNGEIYNYAEVKSTLTTYQFATNSDTEVVLAAYITYGAKSLELLKGMFAYAIYNKQTNEVFIARDRLGVKPVYYYKDDTCFLFASELRAILATKIVPPKVNKLALQYYLALQSVYAPHTIIQNIVQLEAGYYIIINENKVEIKQYWDIKNPQQKFEINSKADAQSNVLHLMQQSVARRLVADVPVAAFLSGGIDSSAIVGLMAQVTDAPQTFNIAFNEADYDESTYAEIIATKFKTKHHKILLSPQTFLDELNNALNAMDTPSGDGINSYVVAKEIVKNNIKVAMSGVGGDELFAGYPSFKQWYSMYHKQWIWKSPMALRKLVANLLPNNSKYSRVAKLLQQKQLDINTFYPLIRQVYDANTVHKLLQQHTINQNIELNLTANNFPSLSQFSIAELLGYTQNTLLKDTDQFSMAVSLEVREPFFDHDLIEYVLQIPDAIKLPTYPKQLLVESLGNLLPPEIVHRKKKGFTFPWEHWMRNELKAFCHKLITDLNNRDFIENGIPLQLWNNFLQNKDVKWSQIWVLVVLEYWLQKNVD